VLQLVPVVVVRRLGSGMPRRVEVVSIAIENRTMHASLTLGADAASLDANTRNIRP
jgi:hypothetical protein